MKKFFNFNFLLILVTCMTFMSFSTVSLTAMNENSFSFAELKSDLLVVFLPAMLSSAMVLFSDAFKHFQTPDWSWEIFIHTKVKSFVIVSSIAIILVLMKSVLTVEASDTLSDLLGVELSMLTSVTLFGLATTLYDNFSKRA